MAKNPFARPATTSGITWADLEGALLAIRVTDFEPEIKTAHGPSSAVVADVFVLDGADKGAEYLDALIFPKVLQSQLRSRMGDLVLGRLGKGAKQPGKSAPWSLNDPNDADLKIGMKWFDSHDADEDVPF